MARLAPDKYDGKLTLRGLKIEPCCSSMWSQCELDHSIYASYTGGYYADLRIIFRREDGTVHSSDYCDYCFKCGAKLEVLPLSDIEIQAYRIANCPEQRRLDNVRI